MPMILAVGEDFSLLKTRAEVLRTTGAGVVCSSGAMALRFVDELELDLVVLCHSMQECDIKQLINAVRSRGVKTLIMKLVSDAWQEEPGEGDFDIISPVSPACLLRSTMHYCINGKKL